MELKRKTVCIPANLWERIKVLEMSQCTLQDRLTALLTEAIEAREYRMAEMRKMMDPPRTVRSKK